MIEVVGITKSYRTAKGRNFVFKDLNFTIPDGRSVAILGRNGVGKSTLLRLLGGQDAPDKGYIRSSSSISFPVGLSGGFQGSLTGRQNVKFVARVYGKSQAELRGIVSYVETFAELGKYFDMPVNTYSAGMRGRLAFGLSFAFPFDYYLIDEALSVGDANFRKKAEDEFKKKIGSANMILVTHGVGQVKVFCDLVILLGKNEVKVFDDVDEGIRAYIAA